MSIGAIALFSAPTHENRRLSTLDDLRGLSRTSPSVALLLAICLLGLTGLPPTIGFLGKLNLFLAAWSEGHPLGRSLAICMAFNAAIAAWYYLRLIAQMYLEPMNDSQPAISTNAFAYIAGAVSAVAVVVLFFAPQGFWSWMY
jgi:NADH-quinone oxidoreductase subunit N